MGPVPGRFWLPALYSIGLLDLPTGAMATAPLQNINLQDAPPVHFSPLWHQLGPFQIGTRETEWGSDPLERHGGFKTLVPDDASIFRSSLARNGTIKWTAVTATPAASSRYATSLFISFPDIDWDMMQSAYGWAGLQFQAWVRGHFRINPQSSQQGCILALQTKQVQEFWIDDEHYFGGDVYGYGKAPAILPLDNRQEDHVINLRVFNGIRMFGGRKPPHVHIELAFEHLCESLDVLETVSVFPDIVAGKAAGEFASLAIRNNGPASLTVLEVKSNNSIANLTLPKLVTIAPLQTRLVKLHFTTGGHIEFLEGYLVYKPEGAHDIVKRFQIPLKVLAEPYAPHKYTYAHPSGIVSYGVIRPPSLENKCEGPETPPILLSLHGAGVEAGSDMSRSSFDALPDLCAWLIIPSGVTPWSGDDWHSWGMADVEAAIAAIPEWMRNVDWKGPGADLSRWFITGHSNGGQGAWYSMIHRNDKVVGGSPISGYLSIPGYVPYVLWQEPEPRALSVLQGSMNTYRLDLLAENLAGIPIFQEHGEADDNVPVFHSRRMFELLQETTHVTDLHNMGYRELPQAGHWFDGIMTQGAMGDFLSGFFAKSRELPCTGRKFVIVTGNPGATSTRGGLKILQLLDPGALGRLQIEILDDDIWRITTANVRRFEFEFALAALRTSSRPSTLVVDGDERVLPTAEERVGFALRGDNEWVLVFDDIWKDRERHGLQLGGLQAILGSRDVIRILPITSGALSLESKKQAVDISRNLFQYFSADTEMPSSTEKFELPGGGNIVLIGQFDRSFLPEQLRPSFPVFQTDDGAITFRLLDGQRITYPANSGTGLILVFPLTGDERVGIAVLGSDAAGLRKAARLFPIRTGSGQPDFILLGPNSGWEGAAGALALGNFDSEWQISASSYFRRF